MSDQSDALLRERMTRLLAAVPPEPVPEIRPRRMPSRGIFRRRLLFAVGLGLLLLTALVVSLPTLSKPTYEAALRAVGVPEGAEVITWGSDKDGNLFDVVYRDATGKEHVLNPLMTPRATPTPRS